MEDSGIFADLCNDPQSNNLLSNDVILSGIVICGILFTSDKLFRGEQLPIGSSANFINDYWLKINEDYSWHMFSS